MDERRRQQQQRRRMKDVEEEQALHHHNEPRELQQQREGRQCGRRIEHGGQQAPPAERHGIQREAVERRDDEEQACERHHVQQHGVMDDEDGKIIFTDVPDADGEKEQAELQQHPAPFFETIDGERQQDEHNPRDCQEGFEEEAGQEPHVLIAEDARRVADDKGRDRQLCAVVRETVRDRDRIFPIPIHIGAEIVDAHGCRRVVKEGRVCPLRAIRADRLAIERDFIRRVDRLHEHGERDARFDRKRDGNRCLGRQVAERIGKRQLLPLAIHRGRHLFGMLHGQRAARQRAEVVRQRKCKGEHDEEHGGRRDDMPRRPPFQPRHHSDLTRSISLSS